MKKHKIQIFLIILFSLFFFRTGLAFASETEGTIDETYKYAWGENIGWLNFDCDECNVRITDSELSGYAWSRQYGWINLNPATSGVENTTEGILSGFAWSSNLGWIDFSGVTINTTGDFLGYATITSDNSGINFNCINADSCSGADFKVKTDWRPASVRQSDSSSGYILFPKQPSLPLTITTTPVTTPVTNVIDKILNFFTPKKETTEKDIIVQIPKIAPLLFTEKWNLLSVTAINSFVFAPLPYEVRILAAKFPELDKTLKSVGVEKLTDMNKLSGVTFKILGLSDRDEKMITNLGTGKIALIKGLPVMNFSLSAKKNLPAEFVFARTDDELIDLNVALSIGEKGGVSQKISSLPGKILRLIVKPISQAKSVNGYFVFKASAPRISETQISRSSFTASALFSLNSLVEDISEATSIEKKLMLSSFEYTDPDHDGIYTADVVSPMVPGEYEIITIINYTNPVLGARKMSMITVVDPEGYVYEKNNGKETRIPSAIVSLYYLNTITKEYKLWSAKDYQQENPQMTDIRGTYSFLVPEGSYYLFVETPGYESFLGKVFVIVEGSSIHQNIELEPNQGWLSVSDWQTALLVVVLLLLLYNLYRNTLRDKLLRLF